MIKLNEIKKSLFIGRDLFIFFDIYELENGVRKFIRIKGFCLIEYVYINIDKIFFFL